MSSENGAEYISVVQSNILREYRIQLLQKEGELLRTVLKFTWFMYACVETLEHGEKGH